MKNYYAKRQILRIMSWKEEEMGEDFKFKWLEKYFIKWVDSLKEKSKQDSKKIVGFSRSKTGSAVARYE